MTEKYTQSIFNQQGEKIISVEIEFDKESVNLLPQVLSTVYKSVVDKDEDYVMMPLSVLRDLEGMIA